ncbi:Por secretion system C-terminal sorting domain-containing protein [Ekhidna lutea]|uniref:Por secretion system C-terminal sorting domain-containing protein n=1 Tax=Ekhidna lutea TaxID=447679 RepID=A0A239KNB2_EKHLU|nr:PKD domain-containing protein [Ekhidna lutea]SNT19049.1 Por secretion system C-terminal sorting domain-containing protein [Ekhidna lutea]
MKRIVYSILFLLSFSWGFAQADIVAAEYFIDEDPGLGMGTPFPVSITQGQSIDLNFTIATSSMGLTNGVHVLGIRIQDENGDWSLHERRLFYIQPNSSVSNPPPADINTVEYFIDEDPGVGNGITLSGSGPTIDVNDIVDIAALSDGFHIIGVRARNTDFLWGFAEVRAFYIQDLDALTPADPAEISAVEYFIDEDPGQGNGTDIPVTQSLSIDITEALSIAAIENGFHTVSVRAKNTDEQWGMAETRVFFIQEINNTTNEISPIAAMEYFIDEDPGTGNGIPIDITSGTLIDITSIQLELVDSYPIGTHTMTIRAQDANGRWGFGETREFMIDGDCPIANFDILAACVGETISLTDQSTGILGDASYKWYADGVEISTFEGDISHIFDSPGLHTFSLAIQNGAVCTDSTGQEITVKPEPFVTFSAEPVIVGSETIFEVEQFNVDTAATWSWDFETDGVIDATTKENTTFTFPAIGDYTTTLTVSDGAGCETTFSKVIKVISDGSDPTANFSTDASCVGIVATFQNTSINMPIGSTFEWDFDEDGVADATTEDATYTFASIDTFEVSLTVTTPDTEVFTESKEIIISSAPTADFNAILACAGETINLVDQSSGLTNDSSYVWYADGEEISTTIGDVTHAFNTSGLHTISLVVQNGTCADSVGLEVDIKPQPFVAFSAEPVIVGSTTVYEVELLNVESDASWSWDFETDGVIDATTEENTTFTFPAIGEYNTTLTISNGEGCETTFSKLIKVLSDGNDPEVDFTTDASCLGIEASFQNLSTNIPGGSTYEWDFDGDGTVDATSEDALYTYSTEGTYQVSLTITTPDTEVLTETKEVDIDAAPTADFDVLLACVGEEINLIDLSSGLASDASYKWYADGNKISTDAGDITHVFNSSGLHTFALVVQNGACADSTGVEVEIKPEPFVVFSAESVVVGSPTIFDVELFNVDSTASWSWDFESDGVIDATTKEETTFTFPTAGEYTTTLTISDNQGCETTFSKIVEVLESGSGPSVDFTTDASCVGIEANFQNTSLNIPDASTHEWDFDGDDVTDATTENALFTYSTSGTYQVSLTITTPDAEVLQESKEVQVDSSPIVDFDFTYETDLFESANVSFINLSEGSGVDFLWDFASEGTSTAISPDFSFEDYEGKTYTICLTATNQCPEVMVCKDVVFTITGLELLKSFGISLYPNPSNGHVNLDFGMANDDNYQVEIMDLTGKIFYDRSLNNTSEKLFELPRLQSGTYLVIVRSESFTAQEKLIIR